MYCPARPVGTCIFIPPTLGDGFLILGAALCGYLYARIAATTMVYMLNVKWLVSLLCFVMWLIGWLPIAGGCEMLLGTASVFTRSILILSAINLVVSLNGHSEGSMQTSLGHNKFHGGGRQTFAGSMLKPHVVKKPDNYIIGMKSRYTFEFQCLEDELGSVLDRNPDCVAAKLPLYLILPQITRQELIQLSKLHGIWIPTRFSAAACKFLFADHNCDKCLNILTIFRCIEQVPDGTLDTPGSHRNSVTAKYISRERSNRTSFTMAELVRKLKTRRRTERGLLQDTEFPPKALSFRQIHRLITKMCVGMEPKKFLEAGCAVCGCLTPLVELGPLQELMPFLGPLHVLGVTRRERFSDSDPIEELTGPVLASGCDKVCVECETALVNGKIPKKALALHNWVGDVPPQLRGLTFAESIMIAKVRHNRCVIRVTSGRMRMSANAIMFSQPILKIYHKLPPSRDEMHEILAFVFTGSAQPTQEEFDRTPMLVRRSKVLAALEWLKLNHEAYAELEISLENLDTYAERDIPVAVEFRRTAVGEEDLGAVHTLAVADDPEEYGTETGECPFSVHGLTGEEYASATMSTLKVIALEHVTRNGGVLGIGRSENPVSMYNSVSAYPSMFPWLFPYGKGGIGHPSHRFKQREIFRKQCLLMYHDKRFQRDPYFPMIAFNHEQLKASSTASKLLADRSKFNAVKARLNAVNPQVAGNIADRFAAGEYVKPVTDAEKLCFDVVKDLDTVAGRVQGSMTSKKYMRNEIWATTAFFSAPTWFITLAWADILHPIALYYAQTDTVYRPEMRTSKERYKLMSKNPVSAARFFNFMVKAFIADVLGWEDENRGLFGRPKAYYGTVEQQGRLTLHLHLLLWIENSLSPQQIRDRIMDPSSDFQAKLLTYLETSHQAEFINGNLEDVLAAVPMNLKAEAFMSGSPAYIPPTHTLPAKPPALCNSTQCPGLCGKCQKFVSWWDKFTHETDDILLRSNLHRHINMVEDALEKEKKKDWRDLKVQGKGPRKNVREQKGCLRGNNICKARFPRPIIPESKVGNDGYINMRHIEPMMNTVNPILTYVSRCNTDVTSLLSGTSVKAVISYVADYVSKVSLKTYQLFASVFQVFDTSSEMLTGEESNHERSRHLIRKMVNSLSTKMEIGSPMASMYVLGHPDHYASHIYAPFSWRTYVHYIRKFWAEDNVIDSSLGNNSVEEKVTISRENGTIVARSMVDDYVFRPAVFENVNLYEWIQCAEKKARTPKERQLFKNSITQSKSLTSFERNGIFSISRSVDSEVEDLDYECSTDDGEFSSVFSDSDWESDDDDETITSKQAAFDKAHRPIRYPFMTGHPCYESHAVSCDFKRINTTIPNFIGGAPPRSDKGDHNFYCMTMLTMFKPWRSPADLKLGDSTWSQTFSSHNFTKRQLELMANFNVRYECNDARDDYFAMMKKQMNEAESIEPPRAGYIHLGTKDKLVENMAPDLLELIDDAENEEYEDEECRYLGPRTRRMQRQASEMASILELSGWMRGIAHTSGFNFDQESLQIFPPNNTRGSWQSIVRSVRQQYTSNKLADLPPIKKQNTNKRTRWDEVEILDRSYFFPPAVQTSEAVNIRSKITTDFGLNEEQARAFSIVANHAERPHLIPLRMYLGGMGGTGKSRVLHAIIAFFEQRNEAYRFLVLGPTGSVAALLNGSTYHSVFRISRDKKSKNQDDIDGMESEGYTLAAVNERLQGVDYIFLDELSMVSCNDLQLLATQAAKARNIHDSTFGGLSVIAAGDFTQLPPTTGPSLYSELVNMTLGNATTVKSQNAVLGKVLWHQFTIVVILRKNMRQNLQSEEDDQLRLALTNMRYGACTLADVKFLKSRIAGYCSESPQLNNPLFRNVSIITALNSQKDTINYLGSKRFATDTRQELIHFRSVDQISTRAINKQKWRNCEQSNLTRIDSRLRRMLWEAPPSTNSEMLPGTLSICIGMPVLLRSNEATELSMTKGQEAVVVGWNESVGPHGQRILDTLFVKLQGTSRPIQIPGLPENVVPLVRSTTHITVLLEDDTLLSISREQVVLLLNFSMTDYSAQGKSRPINLVDLTNCRDHRAYYVALSRATTAKGTVILQDFDEKKITSGMSGYLRQELRELELLDEITKLMYEDRLPRSVTGLYRKQLIRSYLLWKGDHNDPEHFHPIMQWNPDMDPKIPEHQDYAEWRPSIKSSRSHKRSHPNNKDEVSTDIIESIAGNEQKARKKLKTTDRIQTSSNHNSTTPIGLIWDSQNFSCGYDATFTILRSIWKENTRVWSVRMATFSPLVKYLFECLAVNEIGNITLEQSRDLVRQRMHFAQPNHFPYGQVGTSIDRIAAAMSPERTYAIGNKVCQNCNYIDPENHHLFQSFMCAIATRELSRVHQGCIPIDAWLDNYFRQTRDACPNCRLSGRRVKLHMSTRVQEIPELMFITLDGGQFTFTPALHFDCHGTRKVIRLRGVIYLGDAHFSARFISQEGHVWFHDGISTGRSCVDDGPLMDLLPENLRNTRGKQAVALIYAL
jgi:hypothetical protein